MRSGHTAKKGLSAKTKTDVNPELGTSIGAAPHIQLLIPLCPISTPTPKVYATQSPKGYE